MKKQLLALAMAGAMLLGGCQPTAMRMIPTTPAPPSQSRMIPMAIPRIRTTSTIAITA